MIVIRIDKLNGYQSSRPCNNCIDTMRKTYGVNIQDIFYFDDKGNLKKEMLKNMKSTHSSKGWDCVCKQIANK